MYDKLPTYVGILPLRLVVKNGLHRGRIRYVPTYISRWVGTYDKIVCESCHGRGFTSWSFVVSLYEMKASGMGNPKISYRLSLYRGSWVRVGR